MLVGVVGFFGSEVVLSPVVSHCLRLSPFMWGGCWLVWSTSWALKWSCLPLSPVVSLHVGGAGSDMQHEVCGTKYAYNSNNNNNFYYYYYY